jgi:hypothetical protein
VRGGGGEEGKGPRDDYSYCNLILKNNNVGIISPNAEVLKI